MLQQTLNGISLGCVYALLALGYTMVYGILQLINFAHGEVYMVGAYAGILAAGWLAAAGTGAPGIVVGAFVFAVLYGAATGLTVERIAYRPLRSAPRMSLFISALGMSYVLQNAVMLTQGRQDVVFLASWIPGALERSYVLVRGPAGDVACAVKGVQVLIVSASAALMGGLHLLVHRTRTGLAMRAIAQDRVAAALVGVRGDRVIATTFAIGSALAAAAGVMVSLDYGQVNHVIGFPYGLKAFTASVLGGIGSIPGAMAGGVLLGLLETYGAYGISPAYKDVLALGVLIGTLLLRPSGLMGRAQTDRA